jgi:hypothetical protein
MVQTAGQLLLVNMLWQSSDNVGLSVQKSIYTKNGKHSILLQASSSGHAWQLHVMDGHRLWQS